MQDELLSGKAIEQFDALTHKLGQHAFALQAAPEPRSLYIRAGPQGILNRAGVGN